MNKKVVILLSASLIACNSATSGRYHDTDYLERPPMLARTSVVNSERIVEEITPPKTHHVSGLGDTVYLSGTEPVTLHIKQPLAQAWRSVGLALQQRDIKINDNEPIKARYYVSYKDYGFGLNFLKTVTSDVVYQLDLEEQGEETVVTATRANKAEQNSEKNVSNEDDSQLNQSSELLDILYKTLRDDLKNH